MGRFYLLGPRSLRGDRFPLLRLVHVNRIKPRTLSGALTLPPDFDRTDVRRSAGEAIVHARYEYCAVDEAAVAARCEIPTCRIGQQGWHR
jgi:hypothetical protein